MKVLNEISWDILNEYINNNLIIANKHPEYDIWILNYSPKAHSKQFWDDYTTACRGMVIDANGKILARPFKKFKNIEEHSPSEIDMTMPHEIYEKMDGSLIICFYYEVRNEWIIASRGSFISEQSIMARKMIGDKTLKLNETITYLFEIIYDSNRIVVNYNGREELVLLTAIVTKTGEEIPRETQVKLYSNLFTIVKIYNINNLNNLIELKEFDEDNREGYVVRFENGFRVKIKFNEYIRLHSILTNVSNITVWEHMRDNYDFDELLDRVPDEMFFWVKTTTTKLQNEFNEIERQAILEFIRIYHTNQITDRALFAKHAKSSDFHSILFKLYDRRAYDMIIWKMIRPKYSKPFRDGYEYVG